MQYGKLEYNTKSETGLIKLAPDFVNMPSITQLDIIGDWLEQLQNLYEETHEKAFE